MSNTNSKNAAKRYAFMQIQTANKVKAVCMLHDKCVQFISAALDIPQERTGLIIKSQNILSQLQMSLVRDDKVSQSLFYLYDYCYVLLERTSDEDLNNAGDVLAVLRDTFRALAKNP